LILAGVSKNEFYDEIYSSYVKSRREKIERGKRYCERFGRELKIVLASNIFEEGQSEKRLKNTENIEIYEKEEN
jgi:hypothetical protein